MIKLKQKMLLEKPYDDGMMTLLPGEIILNMEKDGKTETQTVHPYNLMAMRMQKDKEDRRIVTIDCDTYGFAAKLDGTEKIKDFLSWSIRYQCMDKASLKSHPEEYDIRKARILEAELYDTDTAARIEMNCEEATRAVRMDTPFWSEDEGSEEEGGEDESFDEIIRFSISNGGVLEDLNAELDERGVDYDFDSFDNYMIPAYDEDDFIEACDKVGADYDEVGRA